MKVKEVLEKTDFKGEFETKLRVFTLIDGVLFTYFKGRMQETLREVNLNEEIKGEISGCIA
jgi:hypothetical protein